MSAGERLVSRLHRVRAIGPERGADACPICESKNGRPINYRLLPDGRVLLHAFCGCDTGSVLRALGLKFSDLFPERLGDYKPERHPFNATQVLMSVAHEITVVHLIARDLTDAGLGDVEQLERLVLAEQRLAKALTMIGELPIPDEIRRIRRAESAPATVQGRDGTT